MKILVPMKRVADPDNANKVKISDDATQVTSEGLEAKPNPFDEYAVETAIRILEDGVGSGNLRGEVVVVTVGGDDTMRQVRQCLAMGADRGIIVDGDDNQLDATIVANALAKVVEKEQPDLVVMGKQAVDGDSNQVSQALAELLGWPQATFAGNIEVPADLSSATVTREVDGGAAKVKVQLPAVISVDLRIVSPTGVNNNVAAGKEYQDGPRYASLKGIMKAKKKPVDKMSLSDLGVDQTLKVRTVSFTAPPQRSAGVIVETVEELVAKLRDEAKVL
ncbi:MAG: electron transfer flavoprotein subunit beta/FixA family protein [Deltaproteobacteria bacterium]|nr:electron transfer flavoprotein subunit beta/FixA family protein [Deltaproteobacteria bacterium]MBN2674819.1 electron transfer flavoprotein subunit beta/FixA family protein [Deltaproteobacteria bacterium]